MNILLTVYIVVASAVFVFLIKDRVRWYVSALIGLLWPLIVAVAVILGIALPLWMACARLDTKADC